MLQVCSCCRVYIYIYIDRRERKLKLNLLCIRRILNKKYIDSDRALLDTLIHTCNVQNCEACRKIEFCEPCSTYLHIPYRSWKYLIIELYEWKDKSVLYRKYLYLTRYKFYIFSIFIYNNLNMF